MVLTHCLSFPFSYFMVNNRIPFILADTLCIACVGAVCVVSFLLENNFIDFFSSGLPNFMAGQRATSQKSHSSRSISFGSAISSQGEYSTYNGRI